MATFKVQGGLKLKGELHPQGYKKMKHYKYYAVL